MGNLISKFSRMLNDKYNLNLNLIWIENSILCDINHSKCIVQRNYCTSVFTAKQFKNTVMIISSLYFLLLYYSNRCWTFFKTRVCFEICKSWQFQKLKLKKLPHLLDTLLCSIYSRMKNGCPNFHCAMMSLKFFHKFTKRV